MTTTSTVTVDSPDGAVPVFEATPDGASKGAVLVVQEAFGITSHIESVCTRFADDGWTAAAPALFHRQGSPVFSYDDFASVGPVMMQLTAEGIANDIEATLARLRAEGFGAERTGIVGFCMGGTVALAAGADQPVGAAVTWYGGGVTEGRFGYDPLVEVAPRLKVPWLGLYGDQDQGIPADQVEALRAAAATASVPTEVVRYPDAGHGFNCDDRDAYHQPSATDAWAKTLAWFDAHLG
ncbi:MAG TPA: dienelactone hydrolase family protein [Acidimicrobiales bacterium]|jgi:carboxymethylenebutenolidase